MTRPRRTRPAVLAALLAMLVAVPLVVTAVPAQAVAGTPDTSATYGFTARIKIGNWLRGCSGVLVDPEWLLTAASCFADTGHQPVRAARPAGDQNHRHHRPHR